MRISNVLAGFSLGEADLLRKAMGKKNPQVMAKMRGSFVEGAKRNGISEKAAVRIFELIGTLRRVRLQQVAFDRLRLPRLPDGVPESEFSLALCVSTADHRGAEHRQARPVPGRCREWGIPVLPPDLNKSEWRSRWSPSGGIASGSRR